MEQLRRTDRNMVRLARMRRARILGAATWYLGILLVLVLFATVVASSLRLQYVPRWARVMATWAPVALALPLATLARAGAKLL